MVWTTKNKINIFELEKKIDYSIFKKMQSSKLKAIPSNK